GALLVTARLKAGVDERPMPAGQVGIDLSLRVPHATHVTARLWRGRATARGLDGGVRRAVDRGEIAVEAVSGAIDGETSFGSQRYVDVFGDLASTVIEGDLTLDRIRGRRLAATVWKGRIDGQRLEVRELEIS